jgi:hypothetical protein
VSASAAAAPLALRVATLNPRNLADRWDERLPLLLADFAALQPDLIGRLDDIWLEGAVRATAARLVFDRPAVDDSTLFPSDHVGLVAQLRLG